MALNSLDNDFTCQKSGFLRFPPHPPPPPPPLPPPLHHPAPPPPPVSLPFFLSFGFCVFCVESRVENLKDEILINVFSI